MKRLFSFLVIASALMVFAMGNIIPVSTGTCSNSNAMEEQDNDTIQSALVDMVADVIEKRGKADSTIYLIGNVIFHHNGAIIQCDSAKKYSSNSMDFFGHVLINKDSAYIYGDKASYDGRKNTAEVFAPIIKMMRGNAVLYTKNLIFNTKQNIGYFSDGGLIIHSDTNHMESLEGEYNSDINEITFRNRVAMRNPSYTAKSDSLRYNLDKNLITFLTNTTIWTKNKEILEASEGFIYTKLNLCQFTKNSYILTSSNEIWADTIQYETDTKKATMMSNIQIVDTINHAIGFGDWGLWDDSIKCAILTRSPSVVTYSSENNDTMYVRADSLIMTTGTDTTYLRYEEDKVSSSFMTANEMPSSPIMESPRTDSPQKDSLNENPLVADSLQRDSILKDSLIGDSLKVDTLPLDSIITDVMNLDTTNFATDTLSNDTIPKLFRGFRNVRGWSSEYQFRCDSIVGHSKDSTGTMFGKPVLWSEDNQLIAEQIDIYTNGGKIDWADLTGEPILIQKNRVKHLVKEDSSRYNQASGNTMQTYFTNNELDSAILNGNVHNIYWMDKNGFTAGIADIKCAELTIFFKERVLKRMRWNGNVEWTIYPLEKIDPKQPRFLVKFEWLDSIRPKTKFEISDREMRDSRREEVLQNSMPRFDIELNILSTMKKAKEENLWEDRKDKTSVRPDYFLTR